LEQQNDHQVLWQQVQLGDEKAFEALFHRYYQLLCSYSCSMLKNIDEAEEVVQTLFYNLWQKRENLEISSSVKSYLYRAAHNDCLNRLQHGKVRRMHASEVRSSSPDLAADASALLQSKELKTRIEEAMQTLPEQCGLVFRMNRFGHKSYAEIAAKLGISVKTVEAHMGKALRIMREQLKEYLTMLVLLIISNA
jgi:RNA polymerase sigma-70 factor, ECF subfamily